MVLTLAALVSFASAHVPHDVIAAAALPYDLTSSQPWYVLLDEGGEHALFRSEDFGQSWDAAGGDHSVDPVTAATLLDDGTLVLLGDRRLWLSTDGESWTTEDLDFDGTGLVGRSTLYIASDDGVWVGTLGGTFTQELAGTAIASVEVGDGDPVAITDDGKVWWRKSGTWTQITIRSRDTVQTAIGTTGGVYVGTTDGRVVQWNGRRWRSCGVVPFTAEVPDNPEIVKLAVRGTTLLVAGGTLGPAVSTDRCASWSDRRSPIETTYQTGGTLENAVTSMNISGDRFVIAGFGGVGVTSDIGVTWHRGTIKPPEWTRRIAWSPSYDTDQTILLAQYGAGVVTSIDAGASFTATGQGLREPNVQMVAYPTDATDASLVFATHNHNLTRSDDGGATWTYPRSVATALALGVGAGERLWATSLENPRSTYAGGVAFSDDGGTNWSSVSGLPSGWGTNEAVGAMDRAPLVCLYSLSEVICSTDDGVSWTSELASNGLPHLECPLGGDIDDMLIADGDGIWKRDGGGTATHLN